MRWQRSETVRALAARSSETGRGCVGGVIWGGGGGGVLNPIFFLHFLWSPLFLVFSWCILHSINRASGHFAVCGSTASLVLCVDNIITSFDCVASTAATVLISRHGITTQRRRRTQQHSRSLTSNTFPHNSTISHNYPEDAVTAVIREVYCQLHRF